MIIMGAGHIYAGKPWNGLLYFFIAVVAVLVFGQIGIGFNLLMLPFVAYGAYTATKKRNEAITAAAAAAEKEAQEKLEQEMNTISAEQFADRIHKVYLLEKSGVLDSTEFAQRKQQIISTLENKQLSESAEDFLASLVPLIRSGALDLAEIARIKQVVFRSESIETLDGE